MINNQKAPLSTYGINNYNLIRRLIVALDTQCHNSLWEAAAYIEKTDPNGCDIPQNHTTAASIRAHYGQIKIKRSIFGQMLHARPRSEDTVSNFDRTPASITSEFKKEAKSRQEEWLQPFGDVTVCTQRGQEWSDKSEGERRWVAVSFVFGMEKNKKTGVTVGRYGDRYDGLSWKVSGSERSESRRKSHWGMGEREREAGDKNSERDEACALW